MVNRTRNKQITIRATEKEHSTIKKRVELSKMNQNEFIISSLIDKPIIKIEGLTDAIKELKAIGNNLNQITRLAHQGKTDNKQEIELLSKEVRKVWQLLKSLKVGQV